MNEALNTTEVFAGYITINGARIQFEFAVPVGSDEKTKDAAALNAIAQQAELNYLSLGELP